MNRIVIGPFGVSTRMVKRRAPPGCGCQSVNSIVALVGPYQAANSAGSVHIQPERLVYTEAMVNQSHPETRVEVEFHEAGGRTTVELAHHGIPAGSPGEAGWAMALDALAARVSS